MAGIVRAIRVQDIARQLWFNWDSGNWGTVPSCQPGTNNLYVAFWIIIDPAYPLRTENVTLQLTDDAGKVLASKSLTMRSDEGAGLEWTGAMPAREYGLSCSVYSSGGVVDTASFTIETIPLPNGKITAIRVQNLNTYEWFNWDNGKWDRKPWVPPGTPVYIAVAAINDGATGNMILYIQVVGITVYNKTEIVAAGGTVGGELPISVTINSNTIVNVGISPSIAGEISFSIVATTTPPPPPNGDGGITDPLFIIAIAGIGLLATGLAISSG